MFATRIILLFSALVVTVNISAQPATKSGDPQDKPRKVKQEPHKAFKYGFRKSSRLSDRENWTPGTNCTTTRSASNSSSSSGVCATPIRTRKRTSIAKHTLNGSLT